MNNPSSLRLSGRNAIPAAIASAGERMRRTLAVDGDRAAIDRIGTGDRAGELGAAAAHQPGEADDLTRPDLQRDVPEHALAVQAGHLQAHRCGRALRLLEVLGFSGGAEHARNEARPRSPSPPAPSARDARCAGPSPCRRGRAPRRGNGSHRRSSYRSARSARIIRWSFSVSTLVSDEVGSSITITRASHATARRISTFCLSAVRNAATLAFASSSNPHCETSSSVLRAHLAPLDQPGATRLDAQEDVFDHAHLRHRRQLLRDRRYPVDPRLARARVADRPVVDEQLSVVGADHAADDLPERRLPGAVGPDERVHGTSGNLDADVVKRLGAGVPLADRDEPDRRDRRCTHPTRARTFIRLVLDLPVVELPNRCHPRASSRARSRDVPRGTPCR